MKSSYGFRSTKKIERLIEDGKRRTGLSASYLVRAGVEEGIPIVLARFIAKNKTTNRKN